MNIILGSCGLENDMKLCTIGSLEIGVGLGCAKVWGLRGVAESVSERLLGLYIYKYRGCSERAYGSGHLLLPLFPPLLASR